MKISKLSMLFAALVLSLVFVNTAASSSRVLIVPFKIHAEKDLVFLKNGIQDMLTSRLTREGEIMPVTREIPLKYMENKESMNAENAALLGTELGADYVVYGSLTVFGKSISTDAAFFNVKKNKAEVTFNESGTDSGDVINHINQFTARINEKLSGTSPAADKPVAKTGKQDTGTRKHPDSLWDDNKKTKEDYSPSGLKKLGQIWKSRRFKTQINSIAIGDVDQDSQKEIAMIDNRDVIIYRYLDKRFVKIGEIKGDVHDKLISVDIADINGNGKDEIFVTSVNKNNRALRSFVLEWNNNRFERIVESAGWYFRVLDIPGRGRILVGQKRGINKNFLAGIDELKWSAGEYVSAGTQNLPSKINIYSYNSGDVMNNGKAVTIAFSKSEYLRIIDKDGTKEWESAEPLSGGSVFLEYESDSSGAVGEYKEQERQYLPLRILIADLDKDGKNEVVVGKNIDSAGRLFSKFRLYKGGHIQCLAWDEFGLSLKWKTREISGHISDYALGDIDNDGQDELIFSVVKKISSVLGDAKSFIAAQEIN